MAVVLTTSAGEIFRGATMVQFNRALARLGPGRSVPQGLDFIYLSDESGNELTLTARGMLRLYFADTPEHDYSLRLGPNGAATEGRELCGRFMMGDLEWVRAQPWERNRPLEEADLPVTAPLPGAVVVPEPDPAPPGRAEVAAAPLLPAAEACSRCGGVMTAGYLTMPGRGGYVPVQWGTGGLEAVGSVYQIRESAELRPMVALRCAACRHLEFRA